MPREIRKSNMTDAEMVAWLETQYDLNDNGCWVWKKCIDKDGYGVVMWKQTYKRVHRCYWLLLGRVIPEDLQMCHGPGCSRACYNPDHLKPGTPAENMADKIRDGTTGKGEKNGLAKLTNEQVLAIRASEKSHKELSEEFRVTKPLISAIILRKIWKHI